MHKKNTLKFICAYIILTIASMSVMGFKEFIFYYLSFHIVCAVVFLIIICNELITVKYDDEKDTRY
jgi:large-conductance mechanosensitive channel